VFEELPTSEHWMVPAPRTELTYEHVLTEAGEAPQDGGFAVACRRLRERHGAAYYSDLLFALTHRRYSASHAQEAWRHIMAHRDRLTAQLGRNPGVAVAALDYLANIEASLVRPTLIDEPKLLRLVDRATHDALTGLFDRSTLRSSLERALVAGSGPVSVIMLDLDCFKQFNDTRGHVAGDRVLVAVSNILLQSVRDSDLAARYGGEELCVVLPGRGLQEAAAVAERLRAAIEQELSADGVTASFGVAVSPQHADTPLALLHAADQALYVSKRAGRNRVTMFQPGPTSRADVMPS
jgi:diguanylate cyclase (GGDEF)-like protein